MVAAAAAIATMLPEYPPFPLVTATGLACTDAVPSPTVYAIFDPHPTNVVLIR
jgi:hypothetical protein